MCSKPPHRATSNQRCIGARELRSRTAACPLRSHTVHIPARVEAVDGVVCASQLAGGARVVDEHSTRYARGSWRALDALPPFQAHADFSVPYFGFSIAVDYLIELFFVADMILQYNVFSFYQV